jgi:ABC-2 type transport system permease protein
MLGVLIVVNLIVLPRTRETLWISLPLSIAVVALVTGVALLIASLNVIFRDVEHLISAALFPWFFLTPILYRIEELHGSYHSAAQVLRYVNFITPPIYALRDPLFFGKVPRGIDVLYLCAAAVVALALGAWVFTRVDDRIAVEL